MKDDLSLFEPDFSKLKKSGKSKTPKWVFPTALGLAAVLGTAFLAKVIFFSGSSTPERKAYLKGELLPPDTEDRDVTKFAMNFLTAFFTITPEVYPTARRKAESMMSDACLSAYKAQAYDREFLNQMKAARVSTDGFHFQEIQLRGEKGNWEAKVIGDISYTTLVNHKKGEFVVTMWLSMVRSPEGKLLVDNVARIR